MNSEEKIISDWNWGYRAARVLHVTNSLGLFSALGSGAMSAGEIAASCSAKPEMLEKLLIACCAMGLLEKAGGKYRNTKLAQTCLVREEPLYQGDMIAHSASMWEFWDKLEDEVRREKAAPMDEQQRHRNFIMAMNNIAGAGRAQMIAEEIDLRGRKRLFDVGGGPGTYSIAFCRRNPELRAVVFDLPETIAMTRQVIAQEQMSDKVSVQEGSWDTDDFGEGNDVVLLSNVLHGPTSQSQMKLSKAFDSMVAGGLVLVQEFLLDDEKTGPLIPALFNIMVGAYAREELCGVIRGAGFVDPQAILSSAEHGWTWIRAEKP